MTPPVLTAFYAALLALWHVWLTMRVVRLRFRYRAAHGDGGEKPLARAIRGQANAAEQIPLTVMLLALAELLGAPPVAIHVLGAAYLFGRVAHGLHFSGVLNHRFRPVGMVTSVLVTTILAVGLFAHALTQMG